MAHLTRKQLDAINLLLNGYSHVEIAEKIGISLRTLQRWLTQAEFADALADMNHKALEVSTTIVAEDIADHIQKLLPKALRILEGILDDVDTRNSDRVRVCELLGRWGGLATIPEKPNQAETALNVLNAYMKQYDESKK